MVKGKIVKNKILYQCEICKLYYKEKGWAEKCQEWCEKHKSCNLEITRHAIKNLESEYSVVVNKK